MPRRRAPGEAGHRPLRARARLEVESQLVGSSGASGRWDGCEHQELQVLAHGLGIAQVVVLLDQPVDQGLFLGAPYLAYRELPQLSQGGPYRGLVHLHRRRSATSG